MGASLRFYLLADDGLKRLSRRMVDDLIHDQDVMPEYAGTKQKVASVTLQNENGKPTEILNIQGWHFEFDAAGRIDEGIRKSIAQLLSPDRAATDGTVMRENRW
jgi:hypothetical protein